LDLTAETDPLSAGLGWTVRYDDRPFVGRASLELIAAEGPKRKLCLLDTGAFHPIVHGEAVRIGDTDVSTITSGDPGFTLGRTFAFAYLPRELATPGREVSITVAAQAAPVSARVLAGAPYDQERRRLTA
jgi:glycine cleavage system aminomethyltransferase T